MNLLGDAGFPCGRGTYVGNERNFISVSDVPHLQDQSLQGIYGEWIRGNDPSSPLGDAMTKVVHITCVTALAALSVVPVFAQETREQAVAGMRKVDAKEMDPTFKTPAPFAQKLVDEALAKHPEVILIAIHATPPKHKNLIVASNFGRIGKIGDEDDLRCIRTGKSNLELNSTGKHFEDELILQDASGQTIGALGVVFNYKQGDDKEALAKIASQIRDEMKVQLPSAAALFGPAS